MSFQKIFSSEHALHPPGRSKTRAAWSALLVLFLFFFIFFFHSFLLKMSVYSALWILKPTTGFTIEAEKIEVAWGKPIQGHRVTITAGKAPFATQLTFKDCSLELSSWWRLFFGDHLLISSLQATQGKGVIDLRTPYSHEDSYGKNFFSSLVTSSNQNLTRIFHADSSRSAAQHDINFLPASIRLHDVSFLLLTEGERYTIDHLSCTLPNKLNGQLTYESILIEAGNVHCRLLAGKAKTLWNGKKLSLRQLRLAEDIALQNLTLIPHGDRIELSISAEVFDGLLRADGSLRHTSKGTFINSAMLGQQLPLGRLSHFLGLHKNLAGTIREGRLTFRGFILHPMEAEISLRMLADNVRLEKRGWASLAVNANLIGRKISLTDFQLKQHENRVTASGEITLPEEWYKLAHAPFVLKLKANISDASQLADLMGTPWSPLTGRLFADGEVHGAANYAEGYLNLQGSAMTAYELPLNSLKLQLLFQGKKTDLTNLELWSGSDHFECSGIFDNKWPHYYQGKATLQSHNLSEKLIPFLQKHSSDISSSWSGLFSDSSRFEKLKLQGGTLQASWEGNGEATQHKGSFQFSLCDLVQNFQKVSCHSKGHYGPEWIAFTSLALEEGVKKYSGQFTLSPRGVNLQNFCLSDDHMTTLSGNVFLPLDATMFLHQPFLLSQSLLQDLPLSIHLQCHDFMIKHKLNVFPWNLMPTLFNGTIDASGLLEKPSLHLSITGNNSTTQRESPKMKLNLSSEQGEGNIDFSLATTNNKVITLQGKLPVGFVVQKESAPLQEKEYWKLGSTSAPLDFKLSIPSLNLDSATACFIPDFFHVEKSFLSGNLTCKGTLNQPELSGELAFQAEKISMKENVAPLHHLQGWLLFNKEKMSLNNASALMGKEKVTLSGNTQWHHQKHDYHLSGTHLLLYQSDSTSALGDLELSLEGESHQGALHGKVRLQEVNGTPKLFMTPFLIPPGINIETPTLMSSTMPAPWTIDVAVTTLSETTSASSLLSPFSNINLHFTGNLFSPTPEGTITLQQLPIILPNMTMSLQTGSCSFDVTHPWHPFYNLIATSTLNNQKIIAMLSKDHTLQLQSDPFTSPTTLVLNLSLSSDPSSEEKEIWLSLLPYWLREESLMEPTTLMKTTPAMIDAKNRNELGFTGCGISYQAEMK